MNKNPRKRRSRRRRGKKPEPSAPLKDLDKRIERKAGDFFERRRAGRITGAAFVIAWCIALLIFFNFFNQYVAYYHANTFGALTIWDRYPFFTDDVSRWLPVLTSALIVAIIGNIALIFVEVRALRQVIRIIMDGFGLAAIVSLLSIFPFDFYVIPGAAAASATQNGVFALLVVLTVIFCIAILVRVIKLIISLFDGTPAPGKAG